MRTIISVGKRKHHPKGIMRRRGKEGLKKTKRRHLKYSKLPVDGCIS
jgi:hypothetical protein